jgi:hypothetical protein
MKEDPSPRALVTMKSFPRYPKLAPLRRHLMINAAALLSSERVLGLNHLRQCGLTESV